MKIVDYLTQGAKLTADFITKNAPTILTGVGLSGMIGAIILAVQEPAKVEEELYELEQEEKAAEVEKHPVGPRIKIYAKHYWRTGLVVIVSSGCIIFANKINLVRQATLVTALQLTKADYKDLKEKIIELDGKKKFQTYSDDISKDKVNQNPPSTVVFTGIGDHLIYDVVSGRYFMSNIENVRQAFDDIRKRLYNEGTISLNEFYDLLNLDHISIGYKFGFKLRTTDDLPEVEWSSHITPDGRTALVMKYEVVPLYDFDY